MKAWKMQKFASDVVYDMRSRNLLPLAVLLVVAILATPFLVGGSGSDPVATPSSSIPAAAAAKPAPEAMSAVVAYEPGLRDYKRRLAELNPSNPFRQQFAAQADAASEALGEGAGFEVSTVDTSTGGGSGSSVPSGGSGGGGSGGGGNGGGDKPKAPEAKTKTKYVSYETDVMVGESAGVLERRDRIPMYSYMPSDLVPALSYMGIAGNGAQAVFLVSQDVTDIGGDGTCFPDASNCQLLGLNAGQFADLIYGGTSYRIQVVRIVRRESSKPPA